MRSALNLKGLAAGVAALGIVIGLGVPSQAQPKAPLDLDQGWDAGTSAAFWFGSQGSQIMLESWFMTLEQGASTSLLSDAGFLERLGFIGVQGYKVPIGFAVDIDRQSGDRYIGLTCAACHTARLTIEGRPAIVEGGPSMADFSGFLDALVASAASTVEQDDKFKRFADRLRVPPGQYTDLHDRLEKLARNLTDRRTQNAPKERYGFGRVDAFGHIFNRVFATAIDAPDNARLADAPVSYPFLWDTPFPMHTKVQWNHSAPNAFGGDLVRNVGELLGVFGVFDLHEDTSRGVPNYPKSSVDLEKLRGLEGLVKDLKSPVWPGDLSPRMKINPTLAAEGKSIYEKRCDDCHQPIKRADPLRNAHDNLKAVGTDATMAENHARRLSESLRTGILEGRPKLLVEKFKAQASGDDILVHVLAGVIRGQLGPRDEPARTADERVPSIAMKAPKIGYKARSLNGIWTTAPYLHNGSVPTLDNLLSKERGPGFWISSSNTFDPEKVGLVNQQTEGAFWFDTTKDGNRNIGHTFGTDLKPEQKKALIEYLKTL